MPHHFDQQSLRCLDALPSTTALACSASNGWQSLLVRHSRSIGDSPVYETPPTTDQLIVVVTRGEIDLESFGGGVWRRGVYRPGAAGMTAPGETDRLRWHLRADHSFEKLHVFLPRKLLDEAAEHLRRPGLPAPRTTLSSLVFNDRIVADVALSLVTAMREGAPDFYAQTAAHWLAVQLLNHSAHGMFPIDPREVGQVSDARLRRAVEFMSAHVADALTLDDLAQEAGVSKFHFTRLFRERTGETPMQRLLSLRMSMAARMLRTSDLPIARIAAECGYPSVSHFSDAFRRFHGSAPGAFRKAV